MKITEHIQQRKKTLFSIEILPPLKGENISTLFNQLDPLMEMGPSFINVTYHREEYIFKKRENGLLEKHAVRKRPGTVGICAAIQNHYHVDTVPHIICGGFTKEETENALIDLHFLGIDNVLALQGDAIKTEMRFVPEEGGHRYASELIEQIHRMNQGHYLDDALVNAAPTHFCIGAAGYPEKHFAAPNFSADLKNLKRKVEMGAQYIITQMFFDNKHFIRFVESCRQEGITVPIIPGLKPITSLPQINVLPQLFRTELPADLMRELETCTDNKMVKQVGVEWTIHQAKELKQQGVPVLHFYSMSKHDPVHHILRALE